MRYSGICQTKFIMEKNELILEKLDRLEKYLIGFKDILNVEDLAFYTGYKPAYIYKLVHESKIPYSKSESGGSKLFFSRKAIDSWLMGNHYKPNSQSTSDAFNHISQYNRRKKG